MFSDRAVACASVIDMLQPVLVLSADELDHFRRKIALGCKLVQALARGLHRPARALYSSALLASRSLRPAWASASLRMPTAAGDLARQGSRGSPRTSETGSDRDTETALRSPLGTEWPGPPRARGCPGRR